MEKIIDQTPYNTSDLTLLAEWSSQNDAITETLYFADNGNYLLHCIGLDAKMANGYGTTSLANEDLIILCEDVIYGWLQVHAPAAFIELFGEDEIQEVA